MGCAGFCTLLKKERQVRQDKGVFSLGNDFGYNEPRRGWRLQKMEVEIDSTKASKPLLRFPLGVSCFGCNLNEQVKD